MNPVTRDPSIRILLPALLMLALVPQAAECQYGYDFNHNGAPGHLQPGWQYVDKYTRFDAEIPGSFGWNRSGITSNTHSVVADDAPGLYEVYYDSNNSFEPATFCVNLGAGEYYVTLYYGKPCLYDAWSFAVTFEDQWTEILTCGHLNACEAGPYVVDVVDGTLDLTFEHVGPDWWSISGVMVDFQTTAVGDGPPAGASGRFAVGPAVPNPFNPQTTIWFELPGERPVDLRVYDVSGRMVRELARGVVYPAGRSGVTWDGQDDDGRALPAGVYLYRLRTGAEEATGRMVLVK